MVRDSVQEAQNRRWMDSGFFHSEEEELSPLSPSYEHEEKLRDCQRQPAASPKTSGQHEPEDNGTTAEQPQPLESQVDGRVNAATELESMAEPLRKEEQPEHNDSQAEPLRKEEQPEHNDSHSNLQQQPAVSPTTPRQPEAQLDGAKKTVTEQPQLESEVQPVRSQARVVSDYLSDAYWSSHLSPIKPRPTDNDGRSPPPTVVKESKEQEQRPPEPQPQSEPGLLGKEETKTKQSEASSLQQQPAVSPTTPGQCEQEECRQQQPPESQLDVTLDEAAGKEQPPQPQTELQSELFSKQEERRQHEQAPEKEGNKSATATTAAVLSADSEQPTEPLVLGKEETKQLEASNDSSLQQQPAVSPTTPRQCEQEENTATVHEDSGKEQNRQPQAPELESSKNTTANGAAESSAASQKPAEPLLTPDSLALVQKVQANRDQQSDESFEALLQACKQHELFAAFEADFLEHWDSDEPWIFQESEDLELFFDFVQRKANLDLHRFAREASDSESSQEDVSKTKTQTPADSQDRARAADTATQADCFPKSFGWQPQDSDSDSDSVSGMLEMVARAKDNDGHESEPRNQAAKDLGPERLVLQEPALFAQTEVWKFLQLAWGKLSQQQRQDCLLNLTKHTHFRGEAGDTWRPSGPSIGTMCSGSGMAELVHRVLTEALQTREVLVHSCEKEKYKKGHLLQYVAPIMEQGNPDPAVSQRHGCVFTEFASLAGTSAYCDRHQRTCRIQPSPLLVVVGYSCKQLSKMNNASNVGVLRSQTGSSGETCFALMKYLRQHRPVAALLENVEEMSRESQESDNVAFFLEQLEALEYSLATKLLEASHFGLPQARKRAWQVLLNRSVFDCSTETLDSIAQAILNTASSLGCQPRPAVDFLLPDNDRYVEEAWRQRHRDFFATKNIAWTEIKLPEVVQSSPWACLLTEREKEVLAYSLMKHFADVKASGTPSADSEGRQFVAVDLSQRLDRARVTSSPDLFFTMLPTQKIWILARSKEGLVLHNRLLTGKESLRLQGFPEVSELQVTDHQQQDLGGNAFASTILMALLLSLYSHLPQYMWTDKEQEETAAADDVERLLCDIDDLD
ncbi:unnamed protein product [Symbiodinium sp. CCMP2592]|nr:unnamed protein product [Symbiodinium sp. CCMP2592]